MGFLGFGDKKQEQQASPAPQQQQAQAQQSQKPLTIWDIPDEQLSHGQRVWKIWNSNQNYVAKNGTEYDCQHKKQIDESLYTHLGCSNLDNLMEMKAPIFYETFYNICDWIIKMAKNVKFIKNNLQSNNDYQQLLGKYEELQKRCNEQEHLIRDLINCQNNNKHIESPKNNDNFVR